MRFSERAHGESGSVSDGGYTRSQLLRATSNIDTASSSRISCFSECGRLDGASTAAPAVSCEDSGECSDRRDMGTTTAKETTSELQASQDDALAKLIEKFPVCAIPERDIDSLDVHSFSREFYSLNHPLKLNGAEWSRLGGKSVLIGGCR